ncbi:LysR family transcriptional regulator [Oerskovia sp. M15]
MTGALRDHPRPAQHLPGDLPHRFGLRRCARLGLSQPAVTAQLARLESEIGSPCSSAPVRESSRPPSRTHSQPGSAVTSTASGTPCSWGRGAGPPRDGPDRWSR